MKDYHAKRAADKKAAAEVKDSKESKEAPKLDDKRLREVRFASFCA